MLGLVLIVLTVLFLLTSLYVSDTHRAWASLLGLIAMLLFIAFLIGAAQS